RLRQGGRVRSPSAAPASVSSSVPLTGAGRGQAGRAVGPEQRSEPDTPPTGRGPVGRVLLSPRVTRRHARLRLAARTGSSHRLRTARQARVLEAAFHVRQTQSVAGPAEFVRTAPGQLRSADRGRRLPGLPHGCAAGAGGA